MENLLPSFQCLISRKQLQEIELQMVSAISFGWFADFGKTLTIIPGGGGTPLYDLYEKINKSPFTNYVYGNLTLVWTRDLIITQVWNRALI